MISYIKGMVAYVDHEMIVMDHQGMGYQIFTPSTTGDHITVGQEAMIHTFLYVREDMLALYGFLTKEELRIFRLLLGINGIGPKVALAVLSTLSVEDLYYAVISDDVKAITRTPGVGAKGARRLIMELKDKLELSDLTAGKEEEIVPSEVVTGNEMADTMDALIALGYSNGEAYRAVHKVKGGEQMNAEQLLKEALKIITLI